MNLSIKRLSLPDFSIQEMTNSVNVDLKNTYTNNEILNIPTIEVFPFKLTISNQILTMTETERFENICFGH